ncbi:MAG: hypothetical protein MHMPM18_004602, partial [Marteilia pararefringens]
SIIKVSPHPTISSNYAPEDSIKNNSLSLQPMLEYVEWMNLSTNDREIFQSSIVRNGDLFLYDSTFCATEHDFLLGRQSEYLLAIFLSESEIVVANFQQDHEGINECLLKSNRRVFIHDLKAFLARENQRIYKLFCATISKLIKNRRLIDIRVASWLLESEWSFDNISECFKIFGMIDQISENRINKIRYRLANEIFHISGLIRNLDLRFEDQNKLQDLLFDIEMPLNLHLAAMNIEPHFKFDFNKTLLEAYEKKIR